MGFIKTAQISGKVKGNLSVILNGPESKDSNMPDLQRYPYKLSLIKCKTDIDVYNFETHYFQLLLLYQSDNYTFLLYTLGKH